MPGIELIRIEVHHDLALLAAKGQGDGSALHRGKLRANEVQPVVIKLRLSHAFARKAKLQNGNAGGIVFENVGRKRSRRQAAQNGLHNGRNLGDGQLNLGLRLKENPDDSHARIGLRLDMFDVVDGRGHGPFAHRDHALFHLVGSKAIERPDHRDNRNINVRKDVLRRSADGRNPENKDKQRRHHKCIRTTKRKPDNPHLLALPPDCSPVELQRFHA